MRKPSITKAILENRGAKESRLAQAKRLGIPETSLRLAETTNKAPRNRHVRAAFLAALGLATAG